MGKGRAPLPFPIVRGRWIWRVDGMGNGSPVPPSGGRGSPGGCDQPPGIAPSADGALDDWGFRPLRRAGVSPVATGGFSLAAASGYFAPCAGRVFRWLRPAGISPAAAGDRGRCPLDPCNFFEKKLIKNFYGYAAATIGPVGRGLAPAVLGLIPFVLTSGGPYPGRDGSSPAGTPAGSRHPHRWSRRRSYR